MQDFSYYNPTRISFGEGVSDRCGECVRALGERALIVYGSKSAEQSGLLGRVEKSLSAAGVSFVRFGGAVPNPRISHAREGIALARREKCSVLVALGGGSVIDTAKCIAAGYAYAGDVWDFYMKKCPLPKTALPIVAIPTIAAAGSETNGTSVISNEEEGLKCGINCEAVRPKYALLDPTLTVTLPAYQTAAGAVDAIAHMLCGYFDPQNDDMLRLSYIASGVRTVMDYAPRAIENPCDMRARGELMWSAAVACSSQFYLGGRADGSSHRLQYPLAARYDMTHGAGVAVTMLGWMRYIVGRVPALFTRLGARLFGTKDDGTLAAARGVIEDFRRFFVSLGMPVTLGELGITDTGDFTKMGEEILATYGSYGCVIRCGAKETAEMLELCL